MALIDELRKQGKIKTSPYTSGANAYNAQEEADPITGLTRDVGNALNGAKDFAIGAGQKALKSAGDSLNYAGESWNKLNQAESDTWKNKAGANDIGEGVRQTLNKVGGAAGVLAGGLGAVFSPIAGVVGEAIERSPDNVKGTVNNIAQVSAAAIDATKNGVRSVSKSMGLSDEITEDALGSIGDIFNAAGYVAPIPGAKFVASKAKGVGAGLLKKASSVVDGINGSTAGKFAKTLSNYTGKAPDAFAKSGFIDYMNIINNNNPFYVKSIVEEAKGFVLGSGKLRKKAEAGAASTMAGMGDMVGMNRFISDAMSSMLGDSVKNKYGWNNYDPSASRGILNSYAQRNVFSNVNTAVKGFSDVVSDAFGRFSQGVETKGLKTQFTGIFNDIRTAKGKFYEDVSSMIGKGVPSMWDRTKEVVSAGLADIANPSRMGKLSDLVEGAANTIGRNGTIEDQLSLIKQIDGALLDPDKSIADNNVFVRTMKDSVMADIDDTIGMVSPQAGNVLEAINKSYSDIRSDIQDYVQQVMQTKDNPLPDLEQVLNTDPEVFHEILKSFDPSTRESILDHMKTSTGEFTSRMGDVAEASGVRSMAMDAMDKVKEGASDIYKDIEASILDTDKIIAYAARGDEYAFDLLKRVTGTKETNDLVRIMKTDDADLVDMFTEMTDARKLQYGLRQAEIDTPPEAVPGRVLMNVSKEADGILESIGKSKENVIAQNKDNAVNKNTFKSAVSGVFSKFNIGVDDAGKLKMEGFKGYGDAKQTSSAKSMYDQYTKILGKETINLNDLLTLDTFISNKLDGLSRENVKKSAAAMALGSEMRTQLGNLIDPVLGKQFATVNGNGKKIKVSYTQVNKDMKDLVETVTSVYDAAGIKKRSDKSMSKTLKALDDERYSDLENAQVGQYLVGLSKKGNAAVRLKVSKIMDLAGKYGIVENKGVITDLIAHLRWLDEILPTDAVSFGANKKLSTGGPGVMEEVAKGAMGGAAAGSFIPVVGQIAGGLAGGAGALVKAGVEKVMAPRATDAADIISRTTKERSKVLRDNAKK